MLKDALIIFIAFFINQSQVEYVRKGVREEKRGQSIKGKGVIVKDRV